MEMAIGIGMFTIVVCVLVMVILLAKSKLVISGDVTIGINDDAEKSITTGAGDKLLGALAGKNIFIIRGKGGRALLGDTLSARGAQVNYVEVYKRALPEVT